MTAITRAALASALAAGAAIAGSGGAVTLAKAPADIEQLHFHHLHLNSTDPVAAAAYYPKPFATTPTNELTGPQTSVWHVGWNTPNSREYNATFRTMGLTIAQMWNGNDDESKLVDLSGDVPSPPGGAFPTMEQVLELRGKGAKVDSAVTPGGFGYLRGPDGVMIENAQSGTVERFNHVHMYHEHPNCAADWYVEHLGAKRPQRGGVTIDDVSISIQPWPGGGLASTRGRLYDDWAVSTANLDVTVARLKREGVTFLEEIHPWGSLRAAMVEGPDRIAIELVEVK